MDPIVIQIGNETNGANETKDTKDKNGSNSKDKNDRKESKSIESKDTIIQITTNERPLTLQQDLFQKIWLKLPKANRCIPTNPFDTLVSDDIDDTKKTVKATTQEANRPQIRERFSFQHQQNLANICRKTHILPWKIASFLKEMNLICSFLNYLVLVGEFETIQSYFINSKSNPDGIHAIGERTETSIYDMISSGVPIQIMDLVFALTEHSSNKSKETREKHDLEKRGYQCLRSSIAKTSAVNTKEITKNLDAFVDFVNHKTINSLLFCVDLESTRITKRNADELKIAWSTPSQFGIISDVERGNWVPMVNMIAVLCEKPSIIATRWLKDYKNPEFYVGILEQTNWKITFDSEEGFTIIYNTPYLASLMINNPNRVRILRPNHFSSEGILRAYHSSIITLNEVITQNNALIQPLLELIGLTFIRDTIFEYINILSCIVTESDDDEWFLPSYDRYSTDFIPGNGINGPTGPSGFCGPTGAAGLCGPTGPTGPAIVVGPAGVVGPQGTVVNRFFNLW